jgi:hypothetical protein
MAETIYDLDPNQFELYLKEKGYDKEREAFLRDQYSQNKTLSGQTRAALGEATETEEGRKRLSVLPMTVPEDMSGIEAIREGEWEWATPGLVAGTAKEAARAVETGEKMRMGLEVPQEDVEDAAFLGAETVLVGGLSAAGRSAFEYDPERVNMFLGDMAQNRELLPQSTGADGKTRYELSDAEVDGVSISPYNISFTDLSKLDREDFAELVEEGKITTVGDVLDHPKLYEAYPQIEDIPITVDESLDEGMLGFFRPSWNLITINKKQVEKPLDFKNTLLHEIQHWVQEREGFEQGTNVRSQEVSERAPAVKSELQTTRDESHANLLETARKALANYYRTAEHREAARDVVGDALEFLEESGQSADKLEEYLYSGKRPLNLGELSPLFEGSKSLLGTEQEVLDFQSKGVFPVSNSAYTPIESLKNEIVFLVEDLAKYSKGNPKLSKLFENKYSINPEEFLNLGFTKRLEELETNGFLIERPKIPQSRPPVSTEEGLRETYMRKAGEVEARNVGNRMEFSQEKRGERPPEATEDRPRDVQWGRSFAEGGAVENQMDKLLEEGGMADDGRDRDPVSGNDIPPGSTAKEVRDDIDVKLSEGEYVVPADVVQYYGVKFFEDLRSKAKDSLEEMDEDGRIGGEPVMEDEELTPEEVQMLQEALGPQGMNEGGMVSQPAFTGYGGTTPTVPGAGTSFAPYGGSTFGGASGTEIRSYINPDTGQTRSFMFINGQPVGTIPEGFVPNTPENREKAEKSKQQTQAVTTQGTRDDGPSFDTATRGAGGSADASQDLGTTGIFSGDTEANLRGQISGPMQNAGLIGRAAGLVGTLAAGPLAGTIARGLATNVAESQSIDQALDTQAKAEMLGFNDVAEEARTKAEELAESFDREISEADIAKAKSNAESFFNAAVDPTQSTGLSRDAFGSDEAFRSAMETVAPTGMSLSEDGRGYQRSGSAAPETSPTPPTRPGSISRGSSSSIAADFSSRAEAGTLGTISADEFSGGSSSGGTSGSSSSSSSGGFADDPAGKDGPTGSGGGGGGSGGGCVVATHAVSTGAFTPEDKQRAVDWCRKNLHGNWFGETFRRGYRRVGNKYIDKGTVTNYYREFEDYVNFVTGKKRNLKGFLTFLYRTPQLFVLGLFTKEK